MQTQLSTELYWLTLTVLMTALFWVPYIANRLIEQGIFTALWDPYGHTDTKRDWARRMMQAHVNAIENLVIFASLVLLVEITALNSSVTAMASIIYFFARLMHFIAFTFAVPLLRVVTFLTGAGVQLTLALTLLNVI